MSVGTLWVARTQTDDACPDCGLQWLQRPDSDVDVLVLLEQPLVAAAEEQLLSNCLRSVGWQGSAACMSLHQNCSSYPDQVIQVIKRQIDTLGVQTLLVFGIDAAQRLDIGLTRGTVNIWQDRRLIVTHGLRQMLEDPPLKAETWRDLCLAAYEI